MGNSSRKLHSFDATAGYEDDASDQLPDHSMDGSSSFFSAKSSCEDKPTQNGSDFISEQASGQFESPLQLNFSSLHASFLAQFLNSTKIDEIAEPLSFYELLKTGLWSIHSHEYVTMCALNILSILKLYAGCVPEDSTLTNKKSQIMYHVLDKLYSYLSDMKLGRWHARDESCCQNCHGCDVKKTVLKHIILKNGSGKGTFCLLCLEFFPKGTFAEHSKTIKHKNVKLQLIHGIYPYHCCDCNKRFVSISVFKEHCCVVAHSPSSDNAGPAGAVNLKLRPICCYLCLIPFSDTDQLKKHELQSLEHGFRKEVAMEVAWRNQHASDEVNQCKPDGVISKPSGNNFSELILHSKMESPPACQSLEDVEDEKMKEFYFCNVCRVKVRKTRVIIHEKSKKHKENCEKWAPADCVQPVKGPNFYQDSSVCVEDYNDCLVLTDKSFTKDESESLNVDKCIEKSCHTVDSDCEKLKSIFMIKTEPSGNLPSKPIIQRKVASASDLTGSEDEGQKRTCNTLEADSDNGGGCKSEHKSIKQPENDFEYYCSPCDVFLHKVNIVSHENGRKHKEKCAEWVSSYSKKGLAVKRENVSQSTSAVSTSSALRTKLANEESTLKENVSDGLSGKSESNIIVNGCDGEYGSSILSQHTNDSCCSSLQSQNPSLGQELVKISNDKNKSIQKIPEDVSPERKDAPEKNIASLNFNLTDPKAACEPERDFVPQSGAIVIGNTSGTSLQEEFHRICPDGDISDYEIQCGMCGLLFQIYQVNGEVDVKFSFDMHVQNDLQHLIAKVPLDRDPISMVESVMTVNLPSLSETDKSVHMAQQEVAKPNILTGSAGPSYIVTEIISLEQKNSLILENKYNCTLCYLPFWSSKSQFSRHLLSDEHLSTKWMQDLTDMEVLQRLSKLTALLECNCHLQRHLRNAIGRINTLLTLLNRACKEVRPAVPSSTKTSDYCPSKSRVKASWYCPFCHRNLTNYNKKSRRQHESTCKTETSRTKSDAIASTSAIAADVGSTTSSSKGSDTYLQCQFCLMDLSNYKNKNKRRSHVYICRNKATEQPQ